MSIQFVVFSKDRACQADQLMRSMEKYVECEYRVRLIYFASNGSYELGYQRLMQEFPLVQGLRECRGNLDRLLRNAIDFGRGKVFCNAGGRQSICPPYFAKGSTLAAHAAGPSNRLCLIAAGPA